MAPHLLSIVIAFNIGLAIGAGIAWGLVMYKWEPVIGVECENCCSFYEGGRGRDVGDL
tara:strand:- start:15598 stop:15771 length:174 start_codon:yes stop_codon:yes gene_type:complete